MPDPQGDHEAAPRAPNARAASSSERPPCNNAKDKRSAGGNQHPQKSYDMGQILGNGSFGVVNEARCLETGDVVAIKKVLQVCGTDSACRVWY